MPRQWQMFTPLLMALTLGLSGCAALQPQATQSGSVMADANAGQPLGDNLNGFLSQSAPGSALALNSSPWGGNVQVMADAPYYAASGRTCRQLQVTQLRSGNVRFEVACQLANGQWASQRLVTQTESGRTRR
ncbi:DVU3141 family protein [Halomonas sp. THAF12]|uniref:DVU3141 family protein n=1 Tax=Halomonas sp. B23F22_10 TaxID=3459515 RepID=UPI00373E95B8